MRFDYIIT